MKRLYSSPTIIVVNVTPTSLLTGTNFNTHGVTSTGNANNAASRSGGSGWYDDDDADD